MSEITNMLNKRKHGIVLWYRTLKRFRYSNHQHYYVMDREFMLVMKVVYYINYTFIQLYIA